MYNDEVMMLHDEVALEEMFADTTKVEGVVGYMGSQIALYFAWLNYYTK